MSKIINNDDVIINEEINNLRIQNAQQSAKIAELEAEKRIKLAEESIIDNKKLIQTKPKIVNYEDNKTVKYEDNKNVKYEDNKTVVECPDCFISKSLNFNPTGFDIAGQNTNFVRVYIISEVSRTWKTINNFNYPYKNLEFQYIYDLIDQRITGGQNLQINYLYLDRWSDFTRGEDGKKIAHLAMSNINENSKDVLQEPERFQPISDFIETYGAPHIFLGLINSGSTKELREKSPQSIVFSTSSTSPSLTGDKRVIRLTINDEHLSIMIVEQLKNIMEEIKNNSNITKFKLEVIYDREAEWTRNYAFNIIKSLNKFNENYDSIKFKDLSYPKTTEELHPFENIEEGGANTIPNTINLEEDTHTFLLIIPDVNTDTFLREGLEPFLRNNQEFKDESKVTIITNEMLFEHKINDNDNLENIKDTNILTIAYAVKDSKYSQFLSSWYNEEKWKVARLGTALDMINTAAGLTNLLSGNITSQMVKHLNFLYGPGGSNQFTSSSDMFDKSVKFGFLNSTTETNNIWNELKEKCYEGKGEDLILTISIVPPNTDYVLKNTIINKTGHLELRKGESIVKKTVLPPINEYHPEYNKYNYNGRSSLFKILEKDILPFWKKVLDEAFTNRDNKRVNVILRLVEETPNIDGNYQSIYMDYAEIDFNKGLKPYELIRPESEYVAKGKITGDIRICFIEDDELTDGFALLPINTVDKLGVIGSFGADITVNVKDNYWSYVDGKDGKSSLSFLLAHEFGHVLGLDDKKNDESTGNNSLISIMNQSSEGEKVMGRLFSDYSTDLGLYGNNYWEIQQLRKLYSNARVTLLESTSSNVEKNIGGNVGSLVKYWWFTTVSNWVKKQAAAAAKKAAAAAIAAAAAAERLAREKAAEAERLAREIAAEAERLAREKAAELEKENELNIAVEWLNEIKGQLCGLKDDVNKVNHALKLIEAAMGAKKGKLTMSAAFAVISCACGDGICDILNTKVLSEDFCEYFKLFRDVYRATNAKSKRAKIVLLLNLIC